MDLARRDVGRAAETETEPGTGELILSGVSPFHSYSMSCVDY